jgi:hypothetical protein
MNRDDPEQIYKCRHVGCEYCPTSPRAANRRQARDRHEIAMPIHFGHISSHQSTCPVCCELFASGQWSKEALKQTRTHVSSNPNCAKRIARKEEINHSEQLSQARMFGLLRRKKTTESNTPEKPKAVIVKKIKAVAPVRKRSQYPIASIVPGSSSQSALPLDPPATKDCVRARKRLFTEMSDHSSESSHSSHKRPCTDATRASSSDNATSNAEIILSLKQSFFLSENRNSVLRPIPERSQSTRTLADIARVSETLSAFETLAVIEESDTEDSSIQILYKPYSATGFDAQTMFTMPVAFVSSHCL